MHIRQGAELARTFYLKSPTELEYIEVVDNSKKHCIQARFCPAKGLIIVRDRRIV